MWVRTPSRPLEYLCNKGSKQGGRTSSPLERAQWELTQQDGDKNEDGRVTKKGRARSGMQDIFSSFCCTVTALLRKVPFITRESVAAILRQMFSTSPLSGTAPLSKYVLFVLFFFLLDLRNNSEKIFFAKKESHGKMNKLFHQPRDVAMTVCIYRVAILSGLCCFTYAHCHITLAIYKPWIIVWDLLGRINMA